jgi:hypothetical protein
MHPYLEHAVSLLRHLTLGVFYALNLIGSLFFFLLNILRVLLTPILSVLHAIALPAIYIGHFALAVLSFPINLLRSLEVRTFHIRPLQGRTETVIGCKRAWI